MAKTPDFFRARPSSSPGRRAASARHPALIFAREGANVVCADINETGVKETAAGGQRQGQPGAGPQDRRHVGALTSPL